MSVVLSAAIVIFAALFCAALIVLIKPLLARYALAIPNARSSHTTPTPQGGGAAVIATAIIAAGGAFFLMAGPGDMTSLLTLLGAVIVMAGIGITADLHAIGVAPRLLLQTAVVAAVIFALPADMHFTPFLPWWAERLCLVIGTLWFVNLVNFMDGLDWMTVAEVVPLTAAVAIIGLLGVLPPHIIVVSLALCGAMIGFAYFNRPVAKLFLGDIGSLPVGLTSRRGCLFCSPGTARTLPRCCCHYTMPPMPPLLCCGGSPRVSRSGRRIGHIFISAPPMAASRCLKSSRAFLPSILHYVRWRSAPL